MTDKFGIHHRTSWLVRSTVHIVCRDVIGHRLLRRHRCRVAIRTAIADFIARIAVAEREDPTTHSLRIVRLWPNSKMSLPVVTVVQLVATRGRLRVKHRRIGRRITLRSHLSSVESHLVFDFFSLFFRHSAELDSCRKKSKGE